MLQGIELIISYAVNILEIPVRKYFILKNIIYNLLSTGAQCNGVCECPNANGRESCGKIINLNDVSHHLHATTFICMDI